VEEEEEEKKKKKKGGREAEEEGKEGPLHAGGGGGKNGSKAPEEREIGEEEGRGEREGIDMEGSAESNGEETGQGEEKAPPGARDIPEGEEEEEMGRLSGLDAAASVPSPTAVARARELHVAILALEERVGQAADEEDYEAAGTLQEELEGLREEMAALGPIDVVHLIMDSSEEEKEEEVGG
jgi:hypothetical protein